MNNQELLILRGLPAAGKSQYARRWVEEAPKKRIRVNRDDIRRMMGPYWVPQREDLVTVIENKTIINAILGGYDVVVDATNLRGTQRFENMVQVWALSAEVTVQTFFDVSVEECIRRDKNRENSVGEDVIRNMARKYNLNELTKLSQEIGYE